ncbi:S8 family peptidase [Actinoplanes sp. HUAS TT8]|uniref:S8 family peptidase n=1 Tax=Actinoplanes sp. HUAS TT8 TaxID=3447453 RepID=UPI003F521487
MRKWTLGAIVTSAVAASAALAAPAPAFAVGTVIGADAPGAVPGRYIVTLKNRGTAPSVHSLGTGKVIRSFQGIPGYAAQLTAVEARRLAADPSVRSVEQDRRVHLAGAESPSPAQPAGTTGLARAAGTSALSAAGLGGAAGAQRIGVAGQKNPTWGLDRIDQRAVKLSNSYTATDDGSAVHAYVIDTGIRIGHQEFGGRATYGYDFADRDSNAADCNGHGTHVAGTIGGAHYGVAKKVQLVAVRVLDCEGGGYLSDVIDGVDWVTRNAVKPAVANMSMGGDASPSLDLAVQQSIASGVTYVVAAGNENTNAVWSSPADVAAAVTVGATDGKDKRAYFSNYGSVVDLFAPGVNIRSSVADSNTATAVYSGTSMASPHVAGAAALLLDASPSLTPAQVQSRLKANATTGKVADRKGSPNRLLFVTAPPAKPVIATTRAAAGTVGTPYAGRVNLKVGRIGSWSMAGGEMPPGLELSRGGVITGTPTEPGEFSVSVRFTDFVPQSVTQTIVIPVVADAPVIDDAMLPSGQAGVDYEGQLSTVDARNGTWTVTAGALPEGLMLDSETGAISGVPTASAGETATFTVGFADLWGGSAAQEFTIRIDPGV